MAKVEKVEKKDQKSEKTVSKVKKSSYSKKKKVKKNILNGLLMFSQLSIILLSPSRIQMEILSHGLQQGKKVLRVLENLHHMLHK